MQSEKIDLLAAALSKAQASIRGAVKDSQNPFFKSSYADLASVWEAAREPLTANGLSVSQLIERDGDTPLMTTILMHASGQWIASTALIVAMKRDPQSFGSAITYQRRYSLAAILGIPQIDDDAESAHGRQPAKPVESKPKPVEKPVEQKPKESKKPKGNFDAAMGAIKKCVNQAELEKVSDGLLTRQWSSVELSLLTAEVAGKQKALVPADAE